MNVKLIYRLCILLAFGLSTSSCLDFVEDGIEVEYEDSSASLTLTSLGSTRGAVGETVSLSIDVRSDFEIKSCIITTTNEGKNGSGFNVSDTDFDDPFADHNFGTIQPGVKSFKVRYDYIIPEEINKTRVTVTIVDESGKVQEDQVIEVVPSVSFKTGIELYSKNTTFHDALSSSEGTVYEDIKSNYSSFTQENVDVQEKIDIVFYFNTENKRTALVTTGSGRLDYELSIENRMVFKEVNMPAGMELEGMDASALAEIIANEQVSDEGKIELDDIAVGDHIGFVADVNAINSLKGGILRIEGLHPATIARYDGLSFVMKCSLIVQN